MGTRRETRSEQEFQEELAELIVGAQDNGVNIFGGWTINIPGDATEKIGLEIYRVVGDNSN